MNIGERLKTLRKEYLNGISQDRFAEMIGTSGAAISRYESSDRAIPNSIILSICREFNVNREWLETGEGEMFIAKESDTLKKISARYNGSETFRAVLDAYVQLEPTEQDAIERYIDLLAQAIASGKSPETVVPPETSFRSEMESEGYTPKARPDREQAE